MGMDNQLRLNACTYVQHNVYLVMERWVGSRPVDRLSVNLALATCLSGSPEYRDNTAYSSEHYIEFNLIFINPCL